MTTADIQSRLAYWAAVYGVPPAIAMAVAQRESGFNQAARGASGEVGTMQIMPATAAGLNINAYDAEANVEGGVRLLAQNYTRFGSWDYALAAYNCGPSCAAQGDSSWPPSTRAYVQGVMAAAGMASTGSTGTTDLWGGSGSGGVLTDLASALEQPDTLAVAVLVLAVVVLVLATD